MTVEFGADNKLLWTLLEKGQADEYIDFLERENARHRAAITNAQYEQIFYKRDNLVWKLWESSIKRHDLDIRDTQTRIIEVKHWFGIDD